MSQQTPDFIAFVQDEADRAVLSNVAEETWPNAGIYAGGAAEAISALNKGAMPQAMLIDFSKSQDIESDAKLIRELAPMTALLGLGTVNDVVLFRKLLAAGFADYLVRPLNAETLQQAVVSAAHSSAGEEKKTGQADLVVIIGARGGVGASTIAVNTAWILSEDMKHNVALVDLDVHYGTAALALDIEPSPGLREALKNPSRIDSLFVTSALVRATDRLYVLGSEEPIDDEIVPDPMAISLMLAEMRGRFQYLIVDLPRSLLRLYDTILPDATKIIVVSDISLPGIRDTVRLLAKIRQVNRKADIKIVANRSLNSQIGITSKDFERGTDSKIDIIIPDDPKVAIASNAGKTLGGMGGGMMSSPSKALNAMKDLSYIIVGKAAAQKKNKPILPISLPVSLPKRKKK